MATLLQQPQQDRRHDHDQHPGPAQPGQPGVAGQQGMNDPVNQEVGNQVDGEEGEGKDQHIFPEMNAWTMWQPAITPR